MLMVNELTLEAINSALLSITNKQSNTSLAVSDTSSSNNVNDIGSCIIYCGNVDTLSTEKIEVYDGWLLCNHAEIKIIEYYELYKKIGTKYGSGDGETTFNLPNFMNLTPNAVYIIKYK